MVSTLTAVSLSLILAVVSLSLVLMGLVQVGLKGFRRIGLLFQSIENPCVLTLAKLLIPVSVEEPAYILPRSKMQKPISRTVYDKTDKYN